MNRCSTILLAPVLWALVTNPTGAREAATTVTLPTPALATGLMWPDWLVILGYLGVVLGMGWFYSRQQGDSEEYFIAVKKHIHPTLIGISLYATLLSTISYLGKPGEMINKGPMLLVGELLALPFAYYIVAYFVIPRLMRHRVTSAYELLEEQLGLSVRLTASTMFIVLRLVWMGLLIYLASVALTVIIGLNPAWIPVVSIVTGLVAVVYTAMGGLRTVVVTDLFQFCLLLFGAILAIAIITYRLGGFSWVPTEWSPNWDVQPWFSFDPHTRVTVFGGFVSMLLYQMATATGDQTAVQRFMATKDTAAARRSYLVGTLSNVVVTVVLVSLGLALLGFFSKFPQDLGQGMTLHNDADRIYPYFIAHYLPVGISGLVVSAALAAAMSSVDSGVNSISAVVSKDYLHRFGRHAKTPEGELRFTRWMAFGIGTVVVLASTVMQHVPGNFMAMTNKTVSLLVVPIFILFGLALWVRRSTPVAAILGSLYGFGASVMIAFWDVLTGRPAISFQWILLCAMVVGLGVGLMLSWWGPRRDNRRGSNVVLVGGNVMLVVLFAAIVNE